MSEQRKSQAQAFDRDLLFNSIKSLAHGTVSDADFDRIVREPPLDMRKARREDAHKALLEIQAQSRQRRQDYCRAVLERDFVSAEFTFDRVQKDGANSAAFDAALGVCASLVANHGSAQKPPLLLVQGLPGSGKTVLCSCAVNYVLMHSESLTVRLVNFGSLKKTQLHANDEEWESLRRKRDEWQDFQQVDLLIIDNFLQDNKGLSAYEQQYLTDLFNLRRQMRKALILTTALDLKLLRDAIGASCYESLCSYYTVAEQLLGRSRNQEILLHGKAI